MAVGFLVLITTISCQIQSDDFISTAPLEIPNLLPSTSSFVTYVYLIDEELYKECTNITTSTGL